MSEYKCPVCKEECEDHCIYCEDCKQWTHFRCQNILKADRKIWKDASLEFHCLSCRLCKDGSFDYLKGFERLRRDADAGIANLSTGVKRESMFLKSVAFDSSLYTDFSKNEQDKVANAIISEYYVTNKIAITSTGNGDCLFNYFSILLSGNESRSIELRYRCCIELLSKKEKLSRHRAFTALEPITPTYDEDCINCTKLHNWSSMWHILALSYMLDVKVDVVYPSVNGSDTHSFKHLNQCFRPPFVDPEKLTVTVMWSSVSPPSRTIFGGKRRGTWRSNHIVPLVIEKEPIQKLQLLADTETPKKESNHTRTETRCMKPNSGTLVSKTKLKHTKHTKFSKTRPNRGLHARLS